MVKWFCFVVNLLWLLLMPVCCDFSVVSSITSVLWHVICVFSAVGNPLKTMV
jgi:hypothetical protein